MVLKPWNKERHYKGPMQKRFRNYRKGGAQLYKDIGILTGYNTERKYNDASGWSAAVLTQAAPNVTLLNGLQLGLTATTRNGISVKLTSVQAELLFKINTAVQTKCTIRWALVWQEAVNGTALTYNGSDMNAVYTAVGTSTMRNIQSEKNIRVLRVGEFSLAPEGIEERHIKIFRKLNLHTKYNTGTAGDVTDIVNGALYIVMNSSENTNPPNITGSSRIRYVDN